MAYLQQNHVCCAMIVFYQDFMMSIHDSRVVNALACNVKGNGMVPQLGGISEIFIVNQCSLRHRKTWNVLCGIAGML